MVPNIKGYITFTDKDGDLVYAKADQVSVLEVLHDEKCKCCLTIGASSRWARESVMEIAEAMVRAIGE